MRLSQAILIRAASVLCALMLIVPFSFGRLRHNSETAPAKKAPTKSVKVKKTSAKSNSKARVSRSSAKNSHHGKKAKASRKSRGQQAIDPDRAREIQSALIREHYLDGEPSGTWDAQTKSALMKFQSDNGWQTKVLPDSRALIKLGLGPSREGLLNPESAAIGNAHELGAEKDIPGGSVPHK